NGGPVTAGSAATVSFSAQADPSAADAAAGFRYSYDFNNDGTFEVTDSSSASATVPASYLSTAGAHVVHGRIKDKDGGFTDYTTALTVSNVPPAVTAPSNLNAYQGASTVFGLGSFADPGANDGPWTVTVQWGDATSSTFTVTLPGALSATH